MFKRIIGLLFILSFLFSGIMDIKIYAKEKRATISYTITKVDKELLSVMIKVKDKNGIKSLKYAEGIHRAPFFRYSYYADKVKNVELTSAKTIRFPITVKNGLDYTFYVENSKKMITHKVFNFKVTESAPQETNENNKENKKTKETARTKETKKNNSQIKNEEKNLMNEKKENSRQTDVADLSKENKVEAFDISNERRAIWVSFLEYKKGYTEAEFRKKAIEILDETVKRRMNTVYMHVRPFSDAMYRSKYFPWSVYASGIEGKDPGFDPLAIMIEEAHKRKVKLHAYINPYRVNTSYIFENLHNSKVPVEYLLKNPAYRWLNDGKPENDRNVLKHEKYYFYNPSKPEVVDLIVNGVKEIVENYKVDGIIFDDYFYPNLGRNYDKNFDAHEYLQYTKSLEGTGKRPLTIIEWRRENINIMVKRVYGAVKKAGGNKEFGISPAGNISNLRSGYAYYVDIDRWGREDGFVDYLEPQLYWGFENKIVPFDKNLERWKQVVSNPKTKLYVALAFYGIVAKPSDEWSRNKYLLSDMLRYQREQKVRGFSLFRYNFMLDSFLKKDVEKEARNHFYELLK